MGRSSGIWNLNYLHQLTCVSTAVGFGAPFAIAGRLLSAIFHSYGMLIFIYSLADKEEQMIKSLWGVG